MPKRTAPSGGAFRGEWPALRAALVRPLAVYGASRAVVLLTTVVAASGSKLGPLRALVNRGRGLVRDGDGLGCEDPGELAYRGT